MSSKRKTSSESMLEAPLLSEELSKWLSQAGPKTIGGLIDAFDDRGFAMLFFLLMFPSALPLPTGGVTHVFQVIVVLVALETLIGRHTVWLPERFRKKSLGHLLEGKVLPFITKFLNKMERFLKPRFSGLLFNRPARGIYGLIVITFTLFAAFAPPYSGLDTLPSMGVVLLSLALFFGDIVAFIFGLVVGILGCTINYAAIIAFFHWVAHFFS